MRRRRPERAEQYESPRYAEIRSILSANLRAMRTAREWTQEQAAEHCSMAWIQYQRVESGNTNATLTTLARLCDGFGITIAALFTPLESELASDD